MDRKRSSLTLMLVCAAMLAIGAAASNMGDVGNGMTSAGQAFLKSLSEQQRAKATFEFDDEKRVGWHFIPKRHRKGIQIKHMTTSQRKAALALLKSGLSEMGYQKSLDVMKLESVVHELETARGTRRWHRDSERYYFSLFGDVSQDGKWGLSIEGHHISLNFVVDKGNVVGFTPTFFGANPGVIQNENKVGFKNGFEVLNNEAGQGFKLVNQLNEEQLAAAIIAEQPPKDVRSAGDAQAPADAPEGLAFSKLTDEQKATAKTLISAYVDAMPAPVAEKTWNDINEAGIDKVHFAWAGSKKPGAPHYYRMHGPTFLAEYCNIQPDAAGNPANHPHALWRDVRGDFAIHR